MQIESDKVGGKRKLEEGKLAEETGQDLEKCKSMRSVGVMEVASNNQYSVWGGDV